MIMRISIFSEGVEAHLTPFIEKFIGNVCIGIAGSLKTPQPIKRLEYDLEGESVRIQVNQAPLVMDHVFSRLIVMDTIRGMIGRLKMADPAGKIKIQIEMEAES